MPTAKKRSVKKAAVPAAGFTRKPAAKANTKPDSNVGTFTQRQTSAVASEAKQKELAQTDAVLLLKAKIELCHHQEDAESQKAATRQAEHDKAVQSYAKAKEQRKKEAEKADKELHNKKVEVLRKLLKHKAEFRAAGSGASTRAKKQKLSDGVAGSRPDRSKTKAKTSVSTAELDPITCECGSSMVFCKDPVCVSLYCKKCAAELSHLRLAVSVLIMCAVMVIPQDLTVSSTLQSIWLNVRSVAELAVRL